MFSFQTSSFKIGFRRHIPHSSAILTGENTLPIFAMCPPIEGDCSINVTAELSCNTVNDLIYYCEDNMSKECTFQEVLTHEIYDLNFVKIYGEGFEDTVYVKEVDVDQNKKIKRVYYMKNGGK